MKFEQRDEMGTESLTRIVCIFPNLVQGEPENQGQSERSCTVVYRLCEQQNNIISQVGTRNSSNTVVIDLPVNLQSNAFCYVINASDGSFTVLVEDRSKAGESIRYTQKHT